jgi:hypothetical protein
LLPQSQLGIWDEPLPPLCGFCRFHSGLDFLPKLRWTRQIKGNTTIFMKRDIPQFCGILHS